jgi:hypothetical protein
VAAVCTAGFQADLCLAASERPGPPAPGTIISGTVYLSAAIDTQGIMSSDQPADDNKDPGTHQGHLAACGPKTRSTARNA